MTQKDKWIDEYSGLLDGTELKSKADDLVKIFEKLLKEREIKASLTLRLKGITSLKEKIKRNEMDTDLLYADKSIVEVLDDIIGIRIICMKIEDEDKILQEIKSASGALLEQKIDIQDSLKKQPKSQKNGHPIYRIKGKIDDEFMFELQIKSLANLFWGEMEHLLIYKNNKYLINSTYYKNEMNSIYKELEIIDDKLTHMESIMTSESLEYNVEEKREILKRIMYLNLKEHFKDVHEDEYLNNNHIFDGIANIVLIYIKPRKKNQEINMEDLYNETLKNALALFLDSEKRSFSFDQFDITEIEDVIKRTDEIQIIIFEIMKNKKNGWWYMFLILSLISYNKDNEAYKGADININDLKPYFQEHLLLISENIQIKLFAEINQSIINANGEESIIVKSIASLLKKKQLYSFSQNKDMRWTNAKYQEDYKYNSGELFKFIRENVTDEECCEGYSENVNNIANNLVEILNDTCIENANVKSYFMEINAQFKEMNFLPLDLIFRGDEKVTIKDILKQIENRKEGEKHE